MIYVTYMFITQNLLPENSFGCQQSPKATEDSFHCLGIEECTDTSGSSDTSK